VGLIAQSALLTSAPHAAYLLLFSSSSSFSYTYPFQEIGCWLTKLPLFSFPPQSPAKDDLEAETEDTKKRGSPSDESDDNGSATKKAKGSKGSYVRKTRPSKSGKKQGMVRVDVSGPITRWSSPGEDELTALCVSSPIPVGLQPLHEDQESGAAGRGHGEKGGARGGAAGRVVLSHHASCPMSSSMPAGRFVCIKLPNLPTDVPSCDVQVRKIWGAMTDDDKAAWSLKAMAKGKEEEGVDGEAEGA
jgi:hypothetical protein